MNDEMLELLQRLALTRLDDCPELVSVEEARRALIAITAARAQPAEVLFEWRGENAFFTTLGAWTPRAHHWALCLWLISAQRGAWVPVSPASYGAVRAGLDRAVRSMAKVDPDLAGVLATRQGSPYGLHLQQRGALVWTRLTQSPRAPRLRVVYRERAQSARQPQDR
jgi:hypothetical protein